MVHSCIAAWGSLLLTLGVALVVVNFVGEDSPTLGHMSDMVRQRTQQRRLAGNGVRNLVRSLDDNFGTGSDRGRRLEEENEIKCQGIGTYKTNREGELVKNPDASTAMQWYGERNNQDFYNCIYKVKRFEIVLSALFQLNAGGTPPSNVTLPDVASPLYIDETRKDHHFIWYDGSAEDEKEHGWKHMHSLEVKPSTPPMFTGASKCKDLKEPLNRRCGVFEIRKDDLACVPGFQNSDNSSSDCRSRVTTYINDLEAAEKITLATAKGQDEDSQKPAYCTVSAILAGANSEDQIVKWLDGFPTYQCKVAICGDAESMFDYNVWYGCTFSGSKTTTVIVLSLCLTCYFVYMGVVADGYLVPALVQIGRGLKMSDALLGATLLALGGAANDFMTGFVSALGDAQKDRSDTIDADSDEDVKLWLGSVFGTGFFVNTLVAAMVMLFAPPEGIPVKSAVFTRDIVFRIIAVGLMLVFGMIGTVHTWGACVMVAFYVIYVMITLKESRMGRNLEMADADALNICSNPPVRSAVGGSFGSAVGGKRSTVMASIMAGQAGVMDEYAVTSDEKNETCWDRTMRHMGWEADAGIMDKVNFVMAFPLRPLFIFTMATTKWDPLVHCVLPLTMAIFIPRAYPFGDLYEDFKFGTTTFWVVMIMWLLGVGFSSLAWNASKANPGKYISPMGYYWMTFLTSLLWVGMLANEVVGAMQTMGVVLGIPNMAMGITMLAWGNCVDNVFATIGLAKAGEFGVAITGIYAAPMFNVLFGNGCILVMLTLMKGGSTPFIMSLCPKILLWCLQAILVFTIVFCMMNNWRVNKLLGVILAVSYPVILVIGFIAEGPGGAQGAE